MKITTRQALKADTKRLLELLSEVEEIHHNGRPDLFRPHGTKYSEAEVQGIIADDTTPVFVAEVEGKVMGYIFCIISEYKGNSIFHDRKNLHMEDVCIDSSCRGMGVGGILMEYVTDWAKSQGVNHIDLDVWEFNDGARRFYERSGFTVQKRRMEKWV